MGLVTTLAVASLAVAAAGTAVSIQQGNRAASSARKGRDIQQAQASVNQQNQIRDQVRAQRVKTAQIAQASADTGVTASSGQIGSASVLSSQAGSNVGNIQGAGITTAGLNAASQKVATAQGNQALAGQVAGLGMAGFNIFSSTPQFKQSVSSIFG